MSVSTVIDLIVQCENRLGWQPQRRMPIWKARAIEASRLKKAMEQRNLTLSDLTLALDYSWHKREPLESPIGLIYRVDAARAHAHIHVSASDIDTKIQEAVNHELANPSADSDQWLRRLMRATGEARLLVLSDWQAAHKEPST